MFCNTYAFSNTIDSLKTDKEIERFIHGLYVQKYPHSYSNKYDIFSIKKPDSIYHVITCDSIISSWSLNKWQKIDFNQDGYTDLFAVIYIRNINETGSSYHICSVVDKGNNTFKLSEIPTDFTFGCHAAMPIFIRSKPYLLYRYHETKDSLEVLPNGTNLLYYDVNKTDTLIYKYGGFIEVNNNQQNNLQIESLYFENFCGMMPCPSYKLNIYKDGTAYCIVGEVNDHPGGNYKGNITKKMLEEIFNLIHYIDIKNLRNYYNVNATDMESCNVNVYFSDGSIKKINDYGMQGTFGLNRLYNLLTYLCSHQNWK